MPTYKIVRFFQNEPSRNVRGLTGLTLQQAQDHCKDPETSSETCTKAANKDRTKKHGPWFDGYTVEKD